jgi:hypothetical protein
MKQSCWDHGAVAGGRKRKSGNPCSDSQSSRPDRDIYEDLLFIFGKGQRVPENEKKAIVDLVAKFEEDWSFRQSSYGKSAYSSKELNKRLIKIEGMARDLASELDALPEFALDLISNGYFNGAFIWDAERQRHLRTSQRAVPSPSDLRAYANAFKNAHDAWTEASPKIIGAKPLTMKGRATPFERIVNDGFHRMTFELANFVRNTHGINAINENGTGLLTELFEQIYFLVTKTEATEGIIQKYVRPAAKAIKTLAKVEVLKKELEKNRKEIPAFGDTDDWEARMREYREINTKLEDKISSLILQANRLLAGA